MAWSRAWHGSGFGPGVPATRWPSAAMPLLICTRLSKPRRPAHGPFQPYASWRTIDEGRVERGQPVVVEAEPGQRVGAQAADEHVGLGDECGEAVRAVGRAQVERRAALAGRRQRQQRADLVRSRAGRCAARRRRGRRGTGSHVGPAITRVRSSTRTPSSGRAVPAAAAVDRASVATTTRSVGHPSGPAPAGCAAHSRHRAHRRRAPTGGDDRGLELVADRAWRRPGRARRGRGRHGRRCRARRGRLPRWWP